MKGRGSILWRNMMLMENQPSQHIQINQQPKISQICSQEVIISSPNPQFAAKQTPWTVYDDLLPSQLLMNSTQPPMISTQDVSRDSGRTNHITPNYSDYEPGTSVLCDRSAAMDDSDVNMDLDFSNVSDELWAKINKVCSSDPIAYDDNRPNVHFNSASITPWNNPTSSVDLGTPAIGCQQQSVCSPNSPEIISDIAGNKNIDSDYSMGFVHQNKNLNNYNDDSHKNLYHCDNLGENINNDNLDVNRQNPALAEEILELMKEYHTDVSSNTNELQLNPWHNNCDMQSDITSRLTPNPTYNVSQGNVSQDSLLRDTANDVSNSGGDLITQENKKVLSADGEYFYSLNSQLAGIPGNFLSMAVTDAGVKDNLELRDKEDMINSFLNFDNDDKSLDSAKMEHPSVIEGSPNLATLDTASILKSFVDSHGEQRACVIKKVKIFYMKPKLESPFQPANRPPNLCIHLTVDNNHFNDASSDVNKAKSKPVAMTSLSTASESNWLPELTTTTSLSTASASSRLPEPTPSCSKSLLYCGKPTSSKRSTKPPVRFGALEFDSTDEEAEKYPPGRRNHRRKRVKFSLVGLSDAEKYQRMRKQNNKASKKCRDKKKIKQIQFACELEAEQKRNPLLQDQLETWKRRAEIWRTIVYEVLKDQNQSNIKNSCK